MMLKTISSGSSGNSYILESESEAILIEAGVQFMKVKKELGFNIRKIVGCVVTHGHFD